MIMFKLITFLSLIVAVSGQTALASTRESIQTYVLSLQASRPATISPNAASVSGTYQQKALNAAMSNLEGVNGLLRKNVREYYVLSCIFFATNRVANKFTSADALSGQEVPGWTTGTNWITNPDYCQWFGVQCYSSLVASNAALVAKQEAAELVLEINLAANNITGSFPPEIVLIGSHLQSIDVANNNFHTCNDYGWMRFMTTLQSLFFAETAWEANPFPPEMRYMANLVDLELRNTYWRGGIIATTWNNFKFLQYLDMGQTYVTLTGQTLPDVIATLPRIRKLFVDELLRVGGGLITVKMTFVQKMSNLEELYMDFTPVRGPMVATFGKATKLRVLHMAYCKLTGALSAGLKDTDMEELYIYGNPNLGPKTSTATQGFFPAGFFSLPWKAIYIEGTKITQQFPKALCDKVGPGVNDVKLGGNPSNCPSGCCTCVQQPNTFGTAGCGNLLAPTPAPSTDSTFVCFSGNSEVEVLNKGTVKMANLALGDSVQVADGKFEPVYSFGHMNANASGEFLQIVAEGRKLELSKDHMVVIEGGRSVPASMVKRGDTLVAASGKPVTVTDIRTVTRQGVFAPFTASGYIVVNDVVASNYIAYQGSDYLKVAGVESPFSYQWLAHMFNSVHRLAYKMGVTGETYTSDGTSTWVSVGNSVGSWMLEQNGLVLVGVLLPSIAIFGLLSLLELLVNSPMIMSAMVVATVSIIAASRSVSVKLTKKI